MITNLSYYEKQEENSSIGSRKGGVETVTATRDMTTGNTGRHILTFLLPVLLANIFQQFYGIVDTVIVGRVMDVNALSAVGCSTTVVFFMTGFTTGMTSGFSILTAQYFGAGQGEQVKRSFTAGCVLSMAVAVVLTVVFVSLARPIYVALETPPELLDYAVEYTTVIYLGTFATVLFNLMSSMIRALGDSRTPLVFLILSGILNIALDFLLVGWIGVAGAAWATVLSQLLSGVLCILYARKKFPLLKLVRLRLVSWREMARHLKMGLPLGFQMSMVVLGMIIVQRSLNMLGTDAVAAFTAASKIDNVVTQIPFAFGITMATFTAQNYGAGRLDRVRRGMRQCCAMAAVAALLVAAVEILAGGWMAELFLGISDENVIAMSREYFLLNGAPCIIVALLFVCRNAIQGLGNSSVPILSGVIELATRIGTVLLLAPTLGFTAVCLANPAAWVTGMVPLVIAYFVMMRRLSAKAQLEQPADGKL